jgi:hypothetical protein
VELAKLAVHHGEGVGEHYSARTALSERDFLTKLIASLTALTLPIHAVVPVGESVASVGLIVALFALPVILPAASAYRHAGKIAALVLGALASAPLLVLASDRDVDTRVMTAQFLLFTFAAVKIAALLWVRSQIGITRLAIFYSSGYIIEKILTPYFWNDNPWKFAFGFAVSVLVLSIVAMHKGWLVPLLAVCSLAAVSVAAGFRSSIAALAFAFIVYAWARLRPTSLGGDIRAGKWKVYLSLVVVAYMVQQAFISLAVRGYLGEKAYEVTSHQLLSQSESVLLSGRVENSAAFQLFINRPIGYGPGVVPNTDDILTGLAGLATRGVGSSSSGADDYILNHTFQFHSVIGDFWVQFGIFGLGLGLLFFAIAASGLLRAVKQPNLLTGFLAISCMWDLLFSPFVANANQVIFAIAVLLPTKTSAQDAELETTGPVVAGDRRLY